MRILHLSTSTLGGAGVVASTIAEIGTRHGHEVAMFTLNNSGYIRAYKKNRSFLRKIVSRFNTFLSLLGTRSKWSQLTSTSVGINLLNDIDDFSPEIIHIHNWFNLLSLKDLKKLIAKYPCVFHIHDARLMTGGCHFTLDCQNYLIGCTNCPATASKKLLVKRSYDNYGELFSHSRPYAMIFPSDWLRHKFSESRISKNAAIITLASNPIPLAEIEALQIKKSRSIICVISELQVPVKGFDSFLDAIKLLREEDNQIAVKVVGGNSTESQSKRASELGVTILGRLLNSETLVAIANSELLVVPSFSENLPTVILEAQAIGTFVLATNIPGCLELVKDNVTGFTCEPTAQSIHEGINRALLLGSRYDIIERAKYESRKAISEFDGSLFNMYQEVIKLHNKSQEAER